MLTLYFSGNLSNELPVILKQAPIRLSQSYLSLSFHSYNQNPPEYKSVPLLRTTLSFNLPALHIHCITNPPNYSPLRTFQVTNMHLS